jgi:hypothetical protein
VYTNFLDTYLKPGSEDGKLGIVDVKAQTKTGKIIDIEIQVNPVKNIGKRLSFYKRNMRCAKKPGGTGFPRFSNSKLEKKMPNIEDHPVMRKGLAAWFTETGCWNVLGAAALKMGIRGYVTKYFDEAALETALRSVLTGGGYIDPSLSYRLNRITSLEGRRCLNRRIVLKSDCGGKDAPNCF